VFFSAKLRAKH